MGQFLLLVFSPVLVLLGPNTEAVMGTVKENRGHKALTYWLKELEKEEGNWHHENFKEIAERKGLKRSIMLLMDSKFHLRAVHECI